MATWFRLSELKGAALDYVVAKCNGYHSKYIKLMNDGLIPLRYSNDWSLAGPIIERESISLEKDIVSGEWIANGFSYGDTPLEAAMRAYVYAKLGDEVEVPKRW